MLKTTVVRDGYKFIGTAMFVAILAYYFYGYSMAIIPSVFAGYFTYFFRNPKRKVPQGEDVIISPADGTVKNIKYVPYDGFIGGAGNKIVIFMSVFDVHINRSPIDGRVKYEQYICGRFRPAYKNDVGFENERHMIGIEAENLKIVVTQIAGILAKRIVSWVTIGDEVRKGDLFGMIKFGSCVEVTLPENVNICLKEGDKLKGGLSVIGKIKTY